MPAIDPIIRLGWEPSSAKNKVIEFDDNLRERIVSFEFTDKASGGDEAKLTIDNYDLTLLDHEAMKTDARLLVQWGYAHSMYPTRVFTIEKVKGFKKLNLEGSVSNARSMLGIQRTRTFENTTEFEVAREIAESLGFVSNKSKQIEPGDIDVPRRGITQAGETDMEFLQRLASKVGATVYVTGGVFHFHERRLGLAPVKTYTYWNDKEGTIIGEPNIEQSVQGRPGQVKRRGHSTRERTAVEGEASNRTDTGRPVLGEELPVSDPLGIDWLNVSSEAGVDSSQQTVLPPEQSAQAELSCTAAETDEEATSTARQAFRRGQRESVKVEITVVGDPEVRADTTVRLLGIGQKHSGNYSVEEAMHSVSASGYTTKLKLKRNATSRSRGSGRSRRRVINQATSNLPAGSDLPYSSELNIWDCQGGFNNEDSTGQGVTEYTDYDSEGQTRTRYESSTSDQGQSRPPDLWEEDW